MLGNPLHKPVEYRLKPAGKCSLFCQFAFHVPADQIPLGHLQNDCFRYKIDPWYNSMLHADL